MELAAIGLGHAFCEALVDGVPFAEEPVLLRFEEVEGAVDEFGRLTVGAAGDLTLDALLGGGIEGKGSQSVEYSAVRRLRSTCYT